MELASLNLLGSNAVNVEGSVRRISKVMSLIGATLATVSVFSSSGLAAPITVSDPALNPYTLPYGDFNVVSLQWADTGTNSSAYYVASSPGQLAGDNAIVIGTGAGPGFVNGKAAGNPTIAGIDAPYATENGQSVTQFTTATTDNKIAPNQTGSTSDPFNTWNAQVGALNTALNNRAPVFYFNLNENGTSDILLGTDLLLWAKVTVTTAAGAQVGGTYYLAGNPFDPNNPGFPVPPGGNTGSALWGNTLQNAGVTDSKSDGLPPDINGSYPNLLPAQCLPGLGCTYYPNGANGAPSDADEWAIVHGDICVNGSTFVGYGSCGSGTVQQNLGANQAAFAAYSLSLNQLLANLNDPSSGLFAPTDVLHISWEMADQDNGYEQLFIEGSGAPQILIPEPITVSLFGMGLLGVVIMRRRRKA